MSCKWDTIGEAGLQFFGKISASISHEIKNTLAIINENAGLLEDFSLMADKGLPLDPARVKTLAGKIMAQIQRANGIVKKMNRFAHSVDDSVKTVDLKEILDFVATLSARLASMRGITLELKPATSRVTITTIPFFLENIIWLCLNISMDAVGREKTVGLVAEESEKGLRIRFTQLEGLADTLADRFPADPEKALLGALKAELAVDFRAEELVLYLPRDIGR